ncbi:MAG: hypothetical protein WD942_00640 [Dehalococcoidia bacterium]
MDVYRFLELWALTPAEGARALGVSEDVLRRWLESGSGQGIAVTELLAATDELERRVKPHRIPIVVRRRTSSSASLLELACEGRHAEVHRRVSETFDLRRVE